MILYYSDSFPISQITFMVCIHSAPTLVFDIVIIVFIQAYLLLSFFINLNFVDSTTTEEPTTTSTEVDVTMTMGTTTSTEVDVAVRVDDSTTTLSGTDVTGE